jgi:DNA-directed RNA polymerase specialized sigma24 family protein
MDLAVCPRHNDTWGLVYSKREANMRNNSNNTVGFATYRQDAPPWIAADPEEAFAIQTASPLGCDSFIHNKEGGELSIESQADEQEAMEEEVFEPRILGREPVDARRPPSSRQGWPFFPHRNRDIGSIAERLPDTVPASGGVTWTISAPEVERAIITLFGRLKRTPTDSEVAKELNLSLIHYHEGLILLRDIETEIATPKVDGGGAELVWVGAGHDHAVFCCLRSEMLTLFKNAVKMLPEGERLIITLRYWEELSDREIRLTLEIPESTLTRLSASASLHLTARLFGSRESDHYGDEVVPAGSRPVRGNKRTAPEAHVYMSGGQDGWLPTGHSWERLGSNATYDHYAQKWFFVDESGELKLVRRQERHEVKFNEVCSTRC